MREYHYSRDGKYLVVRPENGAVMFAVEEVQHLFQAGVEVPVTDMTDAPQVPGGVIATVPFPAFHGALVASGWHYHATKGRKQAG